MLSCGVEVVRLENLYIEINLDKGIKEGRRGVENVVVAPHHKTK